MRAGAAWRIGTLAAAAAALCLAGGASAEPPQPPSPPPAPSCQARDDAAEVAAAAALLQGVRLHPVRRARGAEAVESLDNRGYAYGPAPNPLSDLPLAEPQR